MDVNATNYNVNADYDDGSCLFNNNYNVTFQVDMSSAPVTFSLPEVNGTFNGWCGDCWQMNDLNGDNIWEYTVSLISGVYQYKYSTDNWLNSEDLLNAGSCVLSSWGYTNRILDLNSDTVLQIVCWESCNPCSVSGCTDSAATNYDPNATVDDGSCQYPATCGNITGIFVDNIIHDRAVFNWDDMNSSTCQVDQVRFRYREVGTNSYSTKTMGVPVGSGCNTTNTSKLVLNLTPNTQYEYDFKIWYCNASTVNWHGGGTFTTAPECDNVINVTATPDNTTKTTFCWDTVSTYSFVRLQYRENVPGSSFSNIGGFGVFSPLTCKSKNGLTPGTQYRVMWRTWCSATGGPYRSPVWDGPVIWDQPTSIRVEGGTAINNLDVYPNPSRDIFNVTFTSEDVQNLEVRIINVIGEVVYTEDLVQFVGEYTKQVDLATYTKGVYFLEITTDNGVINKKLILQ